MARLRKATDSWCEPLLEADQCPCERLPDVVLCRIFMLLPPRLVARVCSFVCRSWRDVSLDPSLWSYYCQNTGLRSADEIKLSGGWRALFIAVFGPNLVGSPCFRPIEQLEVDQAKSKAPGPWEPKHRVILDRIAVLDDVEENYHSYSHWGVEAGSQFHRGGGDGVVRENPPVDCSPCPSVPLESVIATSHDWGRLQHYIGFQTFSNKFLDQSPPFVLTAWFAARRGSPGLFRINLLLRDDLKNCKSVWDSGILNAKDEWQQAKFIIKDYNKGVRSVMVKLAGKCTTGERGFYGTKFTDVRLHFIPVCEIKNYADFDEGVFLDTVA
ncbi:hypothetical protein SELMODRAFT_420884 [Selaginella moellendorffii]|uniref:F-box domain-containing protein n=1 Tax=Selaginella moellendorffii TaxID=88036 RepID=D8SDF3_SELML|nr:uncharacterized protein LOC9647398 isoform X2 [Selaginella moellendorffii]EFJ17503.1 hypothetical protein SELMODRAFT_420884 [Selaginella moellendorffii]|eukprot:XP_002981315.1 uncharacterized protein LOC9647398 isoform X2 [Selaginella moellendorffii]